MAAIEIDAESLIFALEDSSDGIRHFLDTQTGEVVALLPEDFREEDDDLPDLIEAESDRFVEIEPISSRQAFEVMEEFTQTVAPARAQPALTRSLQGRHPFRAFKEALSEFEGLREAWFRYKEEVYMEFAREWLEDEGIEATLRQRTP